MALKKVSRLPPSHRKSKLSALVIQREHKGNNLPHLNANLSLAKEIQHNGNRLVKNMGYAVRAAP